MKIQCSIGVSGVSRNTTKQNIGVSGIAREMTKGYAGVNGVAREFYSKVEKLPVGTVFLVKENTSGGIKQFPFVVLHQGNPNASIYDASCNGTWVMPMFNGDITDTYFELSIRQISSIKIGSEIYPQKPVQSAIKTYYETFKSTDAEFAAAIKKVKIPYADGSQTYTLQNGYECNVFIPSTLEVGITAYDIGVDGSSLDFFKNATDNNRTHYNSNKKSSYMSYWLRSNLRTNKYIVFIVGMSIKAIETNSTEMAAIRPIMILDKNYKANVYGFYNKATDLLEVY